MHKKQWEFLTKKLKDNQIAHAYIFSGQEGIGKKNFVREFTKYAHCLSENKPCYKCVNCQMIEREGFPDFMVVRRKDDKNEIEISQIKEVQKFLGYSSYYGNFRMIMVEEAEFMNQEAQNCFLKTLEEPKGNTIIFLVTSRPEMILSTIHSRCQEIKFFKEKNVKIEKDLPAQAGDPELKKGFEKFLSIANETLAEKFAYAKEVDSEEKDIIGIVKHIERHFRDLLLSELGIIKMENARGKKYSIKELRSILNIIDQINQKLIFTNASQKLALEVLLMEIHPIK